MRVYILPIIQKFVDLLLPPRCFSCGELVPHQGELCSKCWRGLNFISSPMCARCGFPFEYASENLGQMCGACLENPPGYDKARAVFAYDGFSKKLILALKYLDNQEGVKAFGQLMWRTIKLEVPKDALIMPVPLHPKKLFSRRFNQSSMLALALAAASGLNCDRLSLKRIKHTPTQGGLSRHARFKNVRGAFQIDQIDAEKLHGKKIILVDDVLTTGATISECVRILKKAGVSSVFIICIARVVKK